MVLEGFDDRAEERNNRLAEGRECRSCDERDEGEDDPVLDHRLPVLVG